MVLNELDVLNAAMLQLGASDHHFLVCVQREAEFFKPWPHLRACASREGEELLALARKSRRPRLPTCG